MNTAWLDAVKFDSNGLIPTIAQDVSSGRILMVAWMNRESLALTVSQKQAVYWSRSRQALWHKGATSGHYQDVLEIRMDCDADVLQLLVHQHGAVACHTGRESCFYQVLGDNGWQTVEAKPAPFNAASGHTCATTTTHDDSHAVLESLTAVVASRKSAAVDSSYVASLFAKGLNKILEKVGEESVETIIAAKDASTANLDTINDLIYETADLWFHTIVMLQHFDIPATAVTQELARRFDLSGLTEKASRAAP